MKSSLLALGIAALFTVAAHADSAEDAAKLLVGAPAWKAGEARAKEFSRVFGAACAKAGTADVPALTKIYEDSLAAPLGDLRDAVFHAVADAWTRAELAKLAAEKREPVNVELAKSRRNILEPPLRADLIDTGFLHSSLHEYRQSPAELLPVERVEKSFDAEVVSFLRGTLQEPVAKFARYTYSAYDAGGSHATRLNRVTFMALLRERDLRGALSVIREDTETWWQLRERNAAEYDWRAEFMRLCGVDWEAVYVGNIVNEWVYFRSRQVVNGAWFGVTPSLEWLCANGSPRGIEMLLETYRRSRVPEQIAPSLAALIPPGENGRPSTLLRRLGPPLEPRETDAILTTLGASLTPTTSERHAAAVLKEFHRLKRREVIPSAERLLEHWSDDTRKLAHTAITALGGKPAELKLRGPVKFELLVNGKPFATLAETSHLMSDSAAFDASGIAQLKRERFARPEAAGAPFRVMLRPGFMYQERGAFTEFLGNPETTPIATAFATQPIRMDEINRIEMTVAPLRVRVLHPRGDKALAGAVRFALIPQDKERYVGGFSRPAAHHYEFSVQTGGYTLQLRAPGASPWKSDVFQVGANGADINATLPVGSDVHFRITAAGWKNHWFSWGIEPDFEHDPNEHINPATGEAVARFVKPGDYKLRVLSHAEANRRRIPSSDDIRLPGDPAPFDGKTIEFTVRADSPAVIDLGKIELPTVPPR